MIADLFSVDGPFVTAYLEAPSAQPQAAQELTLRWKNVRHELEQEGADDETLAAMDAAVGVDTEVVARGTQGAFENRGNQGGTGNKPRQNADAGPDDAAEHTGGDVLALVGAGGKVLLREFLPHVRTDGNWRLGLLPWVTPLLEAEQQQVPYLCVLADRTGADILGSGPDGEIEETVKGDRQGPHLERVQAGGWSQRRYQQRAVEAWDENASEVADEVSKLADRIGARLIAIGGDVHAVRLLEGHLPERQKPFVHVLEHGARGAELDEGLLGDELRRLVQTAIASETVAVLDTFKEEKGQADKAADGPARVVEALQMAMVETLLVHDDPSDDRVAWFGPEPLQLAIDKADVEGMGVEFPEQGRLVDVAVRAALGSGARVRIVPAAVVTSGFGAVLRAATRPGAPSNEGKDAPPS